MQGHGAPQGRLKRDLAPGQPFGHDRVVRRPEKYGRRTHGQPVPRHPVAQHLGNRFRLIAKINFAAGVVAFLWFGTHAEYDKIKVEEV